VITIKGSKIWTPYGYTPVQDLYIGEKIISFNPDRGVCEYDSIQQIEIEYMSCMGMGLNAKSMRQLMTPDHPVLHWNSKTKTLIRYPAQERFMYSLTAGRPIAILHHALFEPYKRSQTMEDIRWSARMAASISNHKRAKLDVGNILDDLGGFEAQEWLDTFFHWHRLQRCYGWSWTVKTSNKEVKRLILDIAPRAGVGAKAHYTNGSLMISVTHNGEICKISKKNGWFNLPINDLVFNLTTKNGNFLMQSFGGTYLAAGKRGKQC
jgi:hypothetical protein